MSINKLGAATTYTQNVDAARTAAASSSEGHKAHGHHHHSAPQSDSVTLSDDAKSLAAAQDAVQATPDVRAQKVADIKQSISDGTYSVSSRVLARKMVDAANSPNTQP